ncbi:MAG TPA: alkaline phosphatase family protein [Candidatus Acidoferrales bacterium]|jgi:phospholipase C|nr:alkaline phosphatase family protein [Candidatus Acidoferrales bacterium]
MRKFASIALAALAGCSPSSPHAPLPADPSDTAFLHSLAAHVPGTTPIEHIVIIVQENRTVDNLFQGYPGADTITVGKSGNRHIKLQPVSLNAPDIDNSYGASIQAFDGGKMDGFAKEAYQYVNRSDIEPYWRMAQEYTLADHMFPTTHGQSWSAHIDLIASTTNLTPDKAMVDFPTSQPWDCEAPVGTVTPTIDVNHEYDSGGGPFPCFSHLRTMADTLDAAHVSWRFYAPSIKGDWIGGAWSSFSSIKSVRYGADWHKVVIPPPTILTDIDAGKLAGVTWVTPDWSYSDHAGSGTTLGPSWVAAVVNKIGQSQYWDSTAIVVLWDDFGGWYDHLPPPQPDFKGLGIRVPCLIISPYVRRGYVIHTQYEFGSVLRLVEETFGLPALGTVAQGYSDARGASMLDAFDFTKKPRVFHAIPAPVFPDYFLNAKPSERAPDN